jgi:preprotein translocase subunit SecY
MKRFINSLKNIWKVEELRKRILLTLSLILIYRIGSFIILPGVDYTKLAAAQESGNQNVLETLLSLFSGGGFSNASIMALGIMPYISASIIMQLLGMAVPAVQKMQSEGESGRKRINNYTRILTIIICALQAPSYLTLYVANKGALPADANTFWWTQSIIVLVAGSMFAVWLGERITDKGIGNGISLLITVGILSRLPSAFMAEFGFAVESGNLIKIVLEIFVFMVVVMGTILIVQGVRKIPLNTAKRVVGSRSAENQGARSYLPIKVNASGVMPIIFAQAIMTVPMMLFSGTGEGSSFIARNLSDIYGIGYNALLAVLIIVFTYFYTAIMINPRKIADDLKRSGGFIPGIRPGEDTAGYIDSLVSRITLPGSIFLAFIAIIPAFASMAGVNDAFAMFFGGTSLLIMVGVVLDTLQQVESYLLNRHMDGLMEGTRVKGRRTANEMSGM